MIETHDKICYTNNVLNDRERQLNNDTVSPVGSNKWAHPPDDEIVSQEIDTPSTEVATDCERR